MKGKSNFLDGEGEFDGEKAYGAVLGTFLVCSWVEIVLAFIKPTVGDMVSTYFDCCSPNDHMLRPRSAQAPTAPQKFRV